MAYNDFSLDMLIRQFNLEIRQERDLFGSAPPVAISDWLREGLRRLLPLALDISTEKARAEFIIAPVLAEVLEQVPGRISLFSGTAFSVAPEQGLHGTCDFLLSLSPLQLTIQAPVVAIVEAKNEDMKAGTNQCIAELVAAQRFNAERENEIATIFGAVTTGSDWRFLKIDGPVVTVDETQYYISEVERIVGILVSMLKQAMGK